MIRKLKKVHWSDIMKNEEYDSIKPPLHLEVRQRRLRMLGHKCHNNPPAKAILQKALKNTKRLRGRPPSSLLNTLINDFRFLNLRIENDKKIEKCEYE